MEFLAIGLLVILAVGVYLWKDTSSSPVVVDTSSEIVQMQTIMVLPQRQS